MKILRIAVVLSLLSAAGFAQHTNTINVDQMKGVTVADKTRVAQAQCNPNTAIPCILIFDPILAVYQAGAMPAKCANCTWLDYTGAFGGLPGGSPCLQNGAYVAGSSCYPTIQSALDAVRIGKRVYVPPGDYTSGELHPYSMQVIDCATSWDLVHTPRTRIAITGTGWAVANASPTNKQLSKVRINNCGFDLSANTGALGGINFRGFVWSLADFISVYLPPTGSQDAVRFDGQDIGARIAGYYNTVDHSLLYTNAVSGHTHTGARWINGANSNAVNNTSVHRMFDGWRVDGGNDWKVLGGSFDAGSGTAHVLKIQSGQGGTFHGVRMEAIGGSSTYGIWIEDTTSYNNTIVPGMMEGYLDLAHVVHDGSAGLNEIDAKSQNGAVYIHGGYGSITGPRGVVSKGLGAPVIVGNVVLHSQTGSISPTTFHTPATDGLFRVSADLVIDVAGASGTVQPFVVFNNGGVKSPSLCAALTITPQYTSESGAARNCSLTFWSKASEPIKYQTTFSGTADALNYSLYYTLERLQQ